MCVSICIYIYGESVVSVFSLCMLIYFAILDGRC